LLGEIGIELGQLGRLDLLDRHLELHRIAGQLGRLVVGGEGHVEGLAFAGLDADHWVSKSGSIMPPPTITE
jgi:hypothetical protein